MTGAGGKQLPASPSEHLSGRGSQTLPQRGAACPLLPKKTPKSQQSKAPNPSFFAESSPPTWGHPKALPSLPAPPRSPYRAPQGLSCCPGSRGCAAPPSPRGLLPAPPGGFFTAPPPRPCPLFAAPRPRSAASVSRPCVSLLFPTRRLRALRRAAVKAEPCAPGAGSLPPLFA